MQASAMIRRAVLRLLVGAGATLLAAGCGSDSSPSDPDAGPGSIDAGDPTALDCEPQSGTRLRRVMREHADGTAEALRLHDSDIGETCTFGLAGDGSLRCLPVADGVPVASGGVMYSDAACTVPIARLTTPLGETPPSYLQAVVFGDDGCTLLAHHYELGNQLAVTAGVTTLYSMNGEECVAVTADGNPYFEIQAEIPPADLVEGTESWVGGRIRMRQIDGGDGSRWCDPLALRDGALDDHACQLAFGEDDSIRCLPAGRALYALFTDDTCAVTAPMVSINPAQCDPGYEYTLESAGACSETRVRALGAEVTAPLYELGETCELVTLSEGQAVHQVGPAVSGSSFAEFTRSYTDVGGRLERGDLDDGLGLRLFRVQWRDSMLDAPCLFGAAADGLERCLPNPTPEGPVATVVSRFSDAECAVPVLVGTANLTCYEDEPAFAREAIAEGTRVYPVTGPAVGPLYEINGGCVAIADLSGIYALGAEIAPEMLVSGEEATE